jgi:glycosyltransferase involved in cell wall biosynthesis
MQLRVLMCGPIAVSGGVSIHTKYLTKYLKIQNVDVELFNLSAKDLDTLESTGLRKFYQRTIGLFIEAYTKRDQYDFIHIQASGGLGGFIPAISAVVISKLLKKKLIVTFHHGQIQKFIKRYSEFFGYVLKNVDNMIVVSSYQERVINDIYPQYNDKLNVIENGYDSTLFFPIPKTECKTKLGLPLDKKIIINVSNLVQIKGHLYLIDAMGEVVKQRPDVLLIIAGDGYMKNSLIERVKELKLEDYLFYLKQ